MMPGLNTLGLKLPDLNQLEARITKAVAAQTKELHADMKAIRAAVEKLVELQQEYMSASYDWTKGLGEQNEH
jgi:TRAP-type mannitol/chloroaromatic compound transport system substrate-binding protein